MSSSKQQANCRLFCTLYSKETAEPIADQSVPEDRGRSHRIHLPACPEGIHHPAAASDRPDRLVVRCRSRPSRTADYLRNLAGPGPDLHNLVGPGLDLQNHPGFLLLGLDLHWRCLSVHGSRACCLQGETRITTTSRVQDQSCSALSSYTNPTYSSKTT